MPLKGRYAAANSPSATRTRARLRKANHDGHSEMTEISLPALADSKGYVLERATMRDYRRLRDSKGELALHPTTNSTAFSFRDARAFLGQKPDR